MKHLLGPPLLALLNSPGGLPPPGFNSENNTPSHSDSDSGPDKDTPTDSVSIRGLHETTLSQMNVAR